MRILVMKTNLFNYNSILFTLIIILISTITIWKLPQPQNEYTHIGIAVYDMDDTFMSDYIDKLQNELETCTFNGKKILYEIFDAEGNANRQEHQLQYMYEQNFDALLINLVTPSSAASVLNETANHKLPVILFNRETDKKDLSISKQTWYVGTQAKKAGAIQADMLQNAWKENQKKLDHNKNNTLDYILIEGEQTHFDSIRRTNGFLENSQNLPLHQLANLSADWQRQLATEKFANLDKTLIHSAEAVICNNDDMALGAVDALEAAGYDPDSQDWPMVLGIDGTTVGLNAVNDGKMLGTVLNDAAGQADGMLELARSITAGTKLPEEYELQDGKYIRMPYRIVTQENLGEIQMLLMKK